jgi:phosphatidate cytidylyltransferase
MLRTRVFTALVLLSLVLAALWLGRVAFVALAALMFGAAIWEWLRLAQLPGRAPLVGSVLLVGVLIGLDSSGAGPGTTGLLLICSAAAALWLTIAAIVVQAQRRGFRLGRVSTAVLGYLLLPAAWFALLALYQKGLVLLFSVFAIVWIADIAAYFTGRAFGKSKLASNISPGKTWAGVAGAVAGVLVAAIAVQMIAPNAPVLSNLLFRRGAELALPLLGVLVAASIAGDLFESLIKRQAGMKDSSHLLPGHGGVLDRIDALIPVLPIAYLLHGWAS